MLMQKMEFNHYNIWTFTLLCFHETFFFIWQGKKWVEMMNDPVKHSSDSGPFEYFNNLFSTYVVNE